MTDFDHHATDRSFFFVVCRGLRSRFNEFFIECGAREVLCFGNFVSASQFGIDFFLERIQWECTDDQFAVDEERRRTANTHRTSVFHTFFDIVSRFGAVHIGCKTSHVESQFLGLFGEERFVQVLLIAEKCGVHFPEFALFEGGNRSLRRRHSILVEAQRMVDKCNANVIRIRFEQFVHRRFDAAAERAFVIAEFDDRHLRIGSATDRKCIDLKVDRLRRIDRSRRYGGSSLNGDRCSSSYLIATGLRLNLATRKAH